MGLLMKYSNGIIEIDHILIVMTMIYDDDSFFDDYIDHNNTQYNHK
jgi:hypothetical protein